MTVATIILENYGKPKKKWFAKSDQVWELVTCGECISTPNVCPKTVPFN